ncbi:MAG: hypothetical protein DDT26_00324 [Dehalococcoidia bacterium]|nr:hypothetical protein [Chloroflexota bacterium]
MPIIVNQPNGKLVISRTGAGADTVTLANGNVPGSFPGLPTTGYAITKILWSGTTTIQRGANTLYSLTGNGIWDLSSMGLTDTRDSAATVVVTTVAGGSAIVEIKKYPANVDGGR